MCSNFEEFENEIYRDLSWRKAEIQDFNTEIKYPSTDRLITEQVEKAVRKSLILLIYSHWEGFIKRTAKQYLKYIVNKEIPSKRLTENFHVLVIKGHFFLASDQIKQSQKNSLSMELFNRIVKDYAEKMENKFFLNIDMNKERDSSIIDTNSNLSSSIYKNIFDCLGIKFYPCFELPPQKSFINSGNLNPNILVQILDKTLIDSRNHIAHGNKNDPQTLIDLHKFDVLKDLIFLLMDNFVDTILTFAEKEYFLQEKSIEAEQHILDVDLNLSASLNQKISSYISQLESAECDV
ncbi:TPA: MAE_28990/MAE_18760 family HEPN-like nuclease [Acinetobacter nosocomialis]